jgi:pimeloyl-ACP methyl ester carboxylesterase
MSCVSIRDHFVKNWREREAERNNQIIAGQILPENIIAILDIPYTDSGHRGHLLDIYYPSNLDGPFPVIINIHGGGFLSENKEFNRLYCFHLAKNGFIVININYRLVFEGVNFPWQLQDVISAFDWVGNNMMHFPANPEKIYVIGHSAGGYLATLASIIAKSERLQNVFNVNKPNININAIAINCGLLEIERRGIRWWGMRWTIFERGFRRREYYQDLILKNLSEITYLPPVFVTSNVDDELDFMSFYFVNILEENDLEHIFYFMERNPITNRRLGHNFDLLHPEWEESIHLRNVMLEYLLRH